MVSEARELRNAGRASQAVRGDRLPRVGQRLRMPSRDERVRRLERDEPACLMKRYTVYLDRDVGVGMHHVPVGCVIDANVVAADRRTQAAATLLFNDLGRGGLSSPGKPLASLSLRHTETATGCRSWQHEAVLLHVTLTRKSSRC